MAEQSISDVVTRLLHAVDDLDWDTVGAVLAERVTLDYTSLWGGEPQQLAGDAVVAAWQQLLPGFDATQHLTGPIVVTAADDHGASCTTTVRGYHTLVEDGQTGVWMVAGRYHISLTRAPGAGSPWRISGITLHVSYEEGERTLVERAQARVSAGAGGRVAASVPA
ncbi:MAG TPA: nuclear transport factor 2 family protein [Natronosporangium sp.]